MFYSRFFIGSSLISFILVLWLVVVFGLLLWVISWLFLFFC